MIQIVALVQQFAKFAAVSVLIILLALGGFFVLIGQWALGIVLLVLAAVAGFVAFKLAQIG